MNEEKIAMLKERAKQLRKTAVTMIYEAQSGHPGGSLSAADMVAALYFSEMHIDPQNPNWADRDRFVLSKGHVCPILYSALGILGYFPESVLHTLRQEGSMLQGHPSMVKCPGIDISTGSLGQGAACAVGVALAGKRDGKDYRVFTMVGDGEINEGIVWEAMMCANKYKLDNYIMLFDNNGLQLDGTPTRSCRASTCRKRPRTSASTSMRSTATTWRRYWIPLIRSAPRRTASPSSSTPTPSRARESTTWRTPSTGTARLRTRSSTRALWNSLRGGYEQWPRVI